MMASELRAYLGHFIECNGDKEVHVMLKTSFGHYTVPTKLACRVTLPEEFTTGVAIITELGKVQKIDVIVATDEPMEPGKG